jgi:uncharacterized protein YheU (UPF0270 family)
MPGGDGPAEPLVIPHEELSADALRGLVEAFVLREGTEYGDHDVPLESKVAQVMRQLERGEARVIFDPESEVVDLVTAQSLRRRR